MKFSFLSIPALLLATGLTVGLAVSTQAAEAKIAVINVKTVFDGYWKTKQADLQLKDRYNDFVKAKKGMVDDYTKANEEYRKLMDSVNDQAVSSEERDKRKKSSEGKLLEIKEIEQSIAGFEKQMDSTLGDQKRRMVENIVKEIRELVTKKASTGSYTLVVDSSALSATGTPVLLFTSGTPDLTDEVLTQLNATAPAGAAISSSDKPDDSKDKPGDKKDDKKDKQP